MNGDLVEVSGTRVFVDDRGAGATTLLYVHGGPGQGAYDFMAAVGDRLAESFRVVGVDQRGCLRSDPIGDEPPLTHELIIDDFEQVRRHLGIERWAVLGHSAGGPLALKYALAHPDAVSAAFFCCATFDCDLTDRYRLPRVVDLLRRDGKHAQAEHWEAVATMSRRITIDDHTADALQALETAFQEVFFHDSTGIAAYENLYEAAGFTDEERMRGLSHEPLVATMYEPTLGLLPRLRRPHALINGVDDLVASPAMIEDYRRTATAPRVVTIDGAGHFPFIEQPDEFVAVVRDLLT